MDAFLAYIILFFLLTLCSSFFFFLKRHKREPRTSPELPPGSMGWPYIGETLQLYSQHPNVFFAAKQKRLLLLSFFLSFCSVHGTSSQVWLLNFRYGEIFKTNILGCPCVMLASPEAARFVLVTHAHLFKPTYPKSKERLIGPSALFFHQGHYHMRLRKLVQGFLSLESLRKLVPHIQALALSAMDSWGDAPLINTFGEMKRVGFFASFIYINIYISNILIPFC